MHGSCMSALLTKLVLTKLRELQLVQSGLLTLPRFKFHVSKVSPLGHCMGWLEFRMSMYIIGNSYSSSNIASTVGIRLCQIILGII